jgi:hypothetical protein
MKWRVEQIDDKQLAEVVTRWNLDSPQDGTEFGESLRLAGWALTKEGEQGRLHFVLQGRDGTYSYRMNSERADVAQLVLKTDTSLTKGLMLGFNLQLERHQIEGALKLGFETDGLIQWVATLSLSAE